MAQRTYTRAEVAEADKNEVLFIIHNKVYSVKKFMDEHPGGHEVLIAAQGKDASEEFDDVSHSLDAREMMKQFQVGEVVEHERTETRSRSSWTASEEKEDAGFLNSWKLPVVLGVLATVIYSYLFG